MLQDIELAWKLVTLVLLVWLICDSGFYLTFSVYLAKIQLEMWL